MNEMPAMFLVLSFAKDLVFLTFVFAVYLLRLVLPRRSKWIDIILLVCYVTIVILLLVLADSILLRVVLTVYLLAIILTTLLFKRKTKIDTQG
jgi:hypothetical protein